MVGSGDGGGDVFDDEATGFIIDILCIGSSIVSHDRIYTMVGIAVYKKGTDLTSRGQANYYICTSVGV